MLTRRWPTAAMAVILLAAMWSLLLAGPVPADDSKPTKDPGVEQSPVPVETPVEESAPPVVEVTPVPEPPSIEPEPPVVVPEPPVYVEPEPPVYVEPEPPVYVEPEPPVYVEPEPAYVEPEPIIDAPVEEVPVEEPEASEQPTLETTEAVTPETTIATPSAVPTLDSKVVPTAVNDGPPAGSPLGVQLAMIAVLLLIGVGYFKLIGRSGRRGPAAHWNQK